MVIYFFIQVCGSFLLLVVGIVLINYLHKCLYILCIALFLKIGAAPFHFWFIWITNEIIWVRFYILRTLQKAAPLVLLSIVYRASLSIFFSFILIRCGLVGRIGGVNVLSLRKILAYSSVSHLGWIFLCFIDGRIYWILYFRVYCLLLGIVVFIIIVNRVYHLSQIISRLIRDINKISFFIGFISLGGLPPLLGFRLKWGVLELCRRRVNFFSLLVIVSSRVVSLFFYIRASIWILIVNYNKMVALPFKRKTFFIILLCVRIIGFWLNITYL